MLLSVSKELVGAEAVRLAVASSDDGRTLSEAGWLDLFRRATDWPALPPMPTLMAVPSSPSGRLWHLQCLRSSLERPGDADIDQARRRYHARCAAYLMAPDDPRTRPLVTVLIPAFNRVGPLIEAVESCLAQTWQPLEIDVVDDGSSDDIAGALRSYGPVVRVHRKENGGVASARNFGIRLARGDFVHMLDSDDLLLPDAVALKVEAFLRVPDAGLCYSDVEDHPRPRRMCRLSPHDLIGAVTARHPFLIPTVMMPRWVMLDTRPFEEDLRRAEDSRYWFTLALRGTKAIGLEQVLTIRRKLGPSLSDLRYDTEEESFTVRARNLCDLLANPRHWRYAAGYYAGLVAMAKRHAPYQTVSGNAARALVRLQATLADLVTRNRPDGFSALPLFAALWARTSMMQPGRFGDDLDRLFAAVPAIVEKGLRASARLEPRDIEAWLSDPSSHVLLPVVGVSLDRLRARERCDRGDIAAIDWILRHVPLPLRAPDAKRFRRLKRRTGSSRLAARLVWNPWRRSQSTR